MSGIQWAEGKVSKRLYEELARGISEVRWGVRQLVGEKDDVEQALVDMCVEAMVRGLLADNPRFDPARFRKACALE